MLEQKKGQIVVVIPPHLLGVEKGKFIPVCNLILNNLLVIDRPVYTCDFACDFCLVPPYNFVTTVN